jgi:hypothetical protein
MQDVDKVAEKHEIVDVCHRRVTCVAASFETDFQTLARAQTLSGILYFQLWHHSQHCYP